MTTSGRTSFLLALAISSWACGAALAQAQDNPLIQRGIAEYDELRFEESVQTLSAALVRTGNTPEQQAAIYRHLALSYLALGREEEAAGAWRSMLTIDAEHEAGSDLSPRFREFFANVRATWETDGRPGVNAAPQIVIRHRSPPQASPGEAVPLEASIEDPGSRVRGLVLAYRQGTRAVFRRIEATRQGPDFAATIPGADVQPPLIEYYFEAIDASGLPIGSRGDVAAPLRTAVPAPGGDVASEPWFWVAVSGGAAVIATAIIVGVVLGTQSTGSGQGTLSITIQD